MPRGSEELTNARKEEIIQACASLYETMSFKDITIKEIGAVTSFTRMSMNHYDMEANSRIERLVEFKTAYGNSIRAVARLLEKFRPQMNPADRQQFLYAFFPFVYGVYPYTVVTDKQKEAMEKAGTNFIYMSIYEMVYACTKRLLVGGQT